MEPVDANSDKTVETHPQSEPSNSDSSTEPSTSIPFSRKRLLLTILVILILTIGLSAAGGYWVGNRQGEENRKESIALVTNGQYQLALEDLAAGRYENARQRLEYISHLDPTYPGVAENWLRLCCI